MAWERTGIGMVVVGLLFVRAAHRPGWQLPGLGAVLVGVGLVFGGARRYARNADVRLLMTPAVVRLVGWSTALLSLLALVMMLSGAR